MGVVDEIMAAQERARNAERERDEAIAALKALTGGTMTIFEYDGQPWGVCVEGVNIQSVRMCHALLAANTIILSADGKLADELLHATQKDGLHAAPAAIESLAAGPDADAMVAAALGWRKNAGEQVNGLWSREDQEAERISRVEGLAICDGDVWIDAECRFKAWTTDWSPSRFVGDAMWALHDFDPAGFVLTNRRDGRLGNFARVDVPAYPSASFVVDSNAEGETMALALARAILMAEARHPGWGARRPAAAAGASSWTSCSSGARPPRPSSPPSPA